jgi:hypothetical protein
VRLDQVEQTGSGIHFGMATLNTFPAPVQRIYYVEEEEADGLVLIHFGDGVVSGPLQVAW